MLLVYRAHQLGSGRQHLVDEDEDGLLRRQLDPLTDHIDELTDRQVRGDEVFLLVDDRDVRFLDLLADDLDAVSMFARQSREMEMKEGNGETYRNAVVVLLADALSFGPALLEGVLVFELGTHLG